MNLENWEPQSELFKRLMQRHIDKARDEAARTALERGRDAGRAAGERDALHAVLDARAVALTDSQRARIEQCQDVTEIRAWLTRAATATHADEVFGE